MQRIVVIGTSGVGKSTLAQQLATLYGYPFIELDALFWEPGWVQASPDAFRRKVATAISGPQWAVGANYSVVRDIVWQRADTLIWLDYSFAVMFGRLFRRTVKRIVSREELWSGNRETWKAQFWSRDSLLLFAIKTHHQRKARYGRELAQPTNRHLHVLRFTNPRQCQHWLEQLRVAQP